MWCIDSMLFFVLFCFFFSSRRRHTRFDCNWSSDVCSSDLPSGTTPQGGRCDQDTAKGKGPCKDCELVAGTNPVNVVSGNKYQSEPIYREASGGLELVLHYNSQQGSTYFQSGPFGIGCSMR